MDYQHTEYNKFICNSSDIKSNKFNKGEDNFNIETKQLLLKYLYKSIILSEYKYKLIEYSYDLPLLKDKIFYISPNYNGIQSLLIFIKLQDQYLSLLIDRKTLTYNINQIDYNKVKIIPIYFRLKDAIYNGTIIDGVLLYNNINKVKNFIVNDIYYFKGDNMSGEKIIKKLSIFSTFLDNIKFDISINNINFIINNLYPISDIRNLVDVYIPKSKYSKSIKGIAFYPEYSGTKLIYLYNNCSNEIENNKLVSTISDTNYCKNDEPNKKYIDKLVIFKMKKTEIIDVYNLYLGEKIIENSKKLFKYKKIGIAYIPTKECSFFCRNIINQAIINNMDGVIIECKYDNDHNKWIPTNLITNKKRPDLINILD